MKTGKGTGKERLAWIALGAVLLVLLFLNLFFLENWLDSDMAAEMIFSRLLAEEGSFLATDQWFYSTEFRVLYTQILMEPLFWIFRDWHTIRVITNLLTYLLLLAGYFFLMKPLRVRRSLVVWTAALLMLPFSETFITHVQIGNTYMPHMILICFVYGLFLRLCGEKRSGVRLCLYLLLCLVCGLSGVRYLLALQAPLALTAVVYLAKSEEFAAARRDFTRAEVRKLLSGRRLKYLGYSAAGALSAVVGYLLNAAVIASHFDFQTYETTNFISIYQGILWERLQNTFGSLLMLFGYIPDKSFLSLRGLVTLAAFAMLAGILFVVRRTGALLGDGNVGEGAVSEKADRMDAASGKGIPEEPARTEAECARKFTRWFLLTAFALNTFVFVFTTSTIVPRYYLTVYLFVLPLLAIYFEAESRRLDKVLLAAGLGACLLLSSAKTVYSFVSTDKNADKRAVCAFLEKEGYEFGYATYWNANIVTELTNGEVEVANIDKLDQLNYFYWSSPKKYYETEHAGKTFLLLTAGEWQEYSAEPVIAEGKAVYEDGSYVVLHFDSQAEWEAYRTGGSQARAGGQERKGKIHG